MRQKSNSTPCRLKRWSRASAGLGLLFVTDADGRAIKADTLRKELRAHLDRLGLTDLHFHGLRHTTATALAEAGASSHEITAITGHQTEQMVKHYTTSAIRKLERSGAGEA